LFYYFLSHFALLAVYIFIFNNFIYEEVKEGFQDSLLKLKPLSRQSPNACFLSLSLVLLMIIKVGLVPNTCVSVIGHPT
jgi:hypothetical protein